MPKYEIWMEGFRLNGEGEEAGANLLGEAEGDTFRDAVTRWLAENPIYKIDFRIDNGSMSIWGCQLFPSREEAARTFG